MALSEGQFWMSLHLDLPRLSWCLTQSGDVVSAEGNHEPAKGWLQPRRATHTPPPAPGGRAPMRGPDSQTGLQFNVLFIRSFYTAANTQEIRSHSLLRAPALDATHEIMMSNESTHCEEKGKKVAPQKFLENSHARKAASQAINKNLAMNHPMPTETVHQWKTSSASKQSTFHILAHSEVQVAFLLKGKK